MTNEQLAAILRPYLLDISDLANSAKHVIQGNEALLLSVVAGRLELITKTLGESIARLDHPLMAMSDNDERPVYRPHSELLDLSQRVNAQLRASLDCMPRVNREHIHKVMYGDELKDGQT